MGKREGKVVVKLGQVTNALAKAVVEMRTYFEPGVSKNLKEERRWKVKDYVHLAKYFSSSHIFAFSQSEEHNNMKVISLQEEGKTFYFKINKYMHSTSINSPYISTAGRVNGYFVIPYNIPENDPVMELVQELKDNVKTSHLTSRVVVFKKIEAHTYLLSHYLLKKEEKKGKANLIKLSLEEIGPRFDLRLQKIEEGVCTGKILFHTYIQKTPEELRERTRKKKQQEEEKAKRRALQEENVRNKKQKRTQKGEEEDDEDDDESGKENEQNEEDRSNDNTSSNSDDDNDNDDISSDI